MSLQNPVKGSFQGRIGGFLAGAVGLGHSAEGGTLAAVGKAIMTTAMIGAAVLFGIDQYLDIGIKNQTLEAAKFDSQSVLAANHLTPKQAADKLNAGEIIYTKDGQPIVGKSLEAFLAYLESQGKAQAEITAAAAKSVSMSEAIRQRAILEQSTTDTRTR
jgi:hypothetical protein